MPPQYAEQGAILAHTVRGAAAAVARLHAATLQHVAQGKAPAAWAQNHEPKRLQHATRGATMRSRAVGHRAAHPASCRPPGSNGMPAPSCHAFR